MLIVSQCKECGHKMPIEKAISCRKCGNFEFTIRVLHKSKDDFERTRKLFPYYDSGIFESLRYVTNETPIAL